MLIMAKNKTINKKMVGGVDVNRFAFTGAFFFSTLFFVITLLAKFNLLEGNFLFDLYSKAGYGTHLFGIVLSLIYGFITGFLLFGFFAWIYDRIPHRK